MNKLKQIIRQWKAARVRRHEKRVLHRLEARAQDELQISEYRGQLYITHRGMPILPTKFLGAQTEGCTILEELRTDYVRWQIDHLQNE